MTDAGERTYRLEPLDASGVFLGLGFVQCGLLGGGITLAVSAISTGLPLIVAAVPVLAAVALSFARVGGRAAWEWMPLACGWVVRRVGWGGRWEAPLPLWPVDTGKPPPLPPCLGGLEIRHTPWRDGRVLGYIHDAERKAATAVVPVSASQFVVEPSSEQERLLAGWGELLGQFASDRVAVSHLAWSDLTRPSTLQDHTRWLEANRGSAADQRAMASYDRLLDVARSHSTVHDVVVTITVARDRLRRRTTTDEPASTDPIERSLCSAVDSLVRGLHSAGLEAGEPFDEVGLQRMLRLRIDPTIEASHRMDGPLTERLGLVTSASSGPLVVEPGWRHVRVDASWHRTFWAASWPRIPVPPCWLEPFISTDITRAMTVVLVPVSAYQSRRRIERDLVKLESDAATKEDQGRRVDARHRRATETLLEREQELMAGFPEMAYLGLVTVSASSEEELDDRSDEVEQIAREAGIELRILDGRQDVAWAAALPLGLAPRTLLGS